MTVDVMTNRTSLRVDLRRLKRRCDHGDCNYIIALISLLRCFLPRTFALTPPACANGATVVPLRTRGEPNFQSGRHEHHFTGENDTVLTVSNKF